MDFKYHLEKSWNTFTKFLPALLISTLVLIGISLITLGILAPVCTAGYMQSLLRAIRDDRKPEVGDLFSHMRLFLPLFVFTIVVFIVLMIGFAMLVLPGIIASIALVYFCLYVLPLMTDRDMGLIDAVKESYRMAIQEPIIEQVVVVALYLGITALGQSVIVGILFTQPFATLFILSAFMERGSKELPAPEKKDEPATPQAETKKDEAGIQEEKPADQQ